MLSSMSFRLSGLFLVLAFLQGCAPLTMNNYAVAVYPPLDELLAATAKLPKGALFREYSGKYVLIEQPVDLGAPEHEVVDNAFDLRVYNPGDGSAFSLRGTQRSGHTVVQMPTDANRARLDSNEASYQRDKNQMSSFSRELAASSQLSQETIAQSGERTQAVFAASASMVDAAGAIRVARDEEAALSALNETIEEANAIGPNPLGIRKVSFLFFEQRTDVQGEYNHLLTGGAMEARQIVGIVANIEFDDGRRAELVRQMAVIIYQGGFAEFTDAPEPYQMVDRHNLPKIYDGDNVRKDWNELLARLAMKDLAHISKNRKIVQR